MEEDIGGVDQGQGLEAGMLMQVEVEVKVEEEVGGFSSFDCQSIGALPGAPPIRGATGANAT